MSARPPSRWTPRALALCLCVLAACGLLGHGAGDRPVDVRFTGNQALSTRELEQVLERFFKDYAAASNPKSAVDDAAFDLERAYLAAGFPRARVDYEFQPEEGGRALATFTIQEGPRIELGDVVFAGATAFRASELQAFFRPAATGLLEESANHYVEASIASAVEELELFYAARGWFEARVEIARVEFDEPPTRATVHVRVHEGPRCRIASIAIGGVDPRVDAAALEAARAEFIGRPYYERLSIEIQGRIEETCARAGFADVRVTRTARAVAPDGRVDLAFQVECGPVVTVGQIRVVGNAATRNAFVRSRLAVRSGEPYTREAERTSFNRLYRSGVFDRVTIRPIVPADEDPSEGTVTRDVQVDLREGRSIEAWVEPGWGSYEELRLAAGARHKNLFGTGRILDFHGSLSRRAQAGELSLIDPWLFESDVVADFSLFGKRREEPSFTRLEQGLSATLTRRFSRAVEGSIGYELKNTRAADVELLDDEARAVIDQVDISQVEATFAHDTRDSVFQPTSGSFSKIGFEYGSAALGSELDFARLQAQHASFVALGGVTVLGVAAKLGVVQPLGGTSAIPLQERFFNGGENSVRSFRESELGPKDDQGEPLGGEAFSTFSIELRRRLRGRFEGALFYDLGNVTARHQDVLGFEGYEHGIGIGLRYLLPVGPIRLDAAANPDPGEFESRFVVHLALGLSF